MAKAKMQTRTRSENATEADWRDEGNFGLDKYGDPGPAAQKRLRYVDRDRYEVRFVPVGKKTKTG